MRSYTVGLDLGKMSDYSAMAFLEERDRPEGMEAERPVFDVTYLHRWRIGTPYPKIVSSVKTLLEGERFLHRSYQGGGKLVLRRVSRVTLAVDATGVGVPVVDMFNDARVNGEIRPIAITGGHKAHNEGAIWYVPKRILVSTLQVALQAGTIQIASQLADAKVLANELQNFQLTFTEAANDTYEGRQGTHDDYVLAVAMALWSAQTGQITVTQAERSLFEGINQSRPWIGGR
jgi:hypothetical protein